MADRRPAGWNQWAEVVGRDPREIRFIGDMPHAWVASDFVRAALDMFAWERRDDRALVLGGGLSADWLTGDGLGIAGLATPYGRLDFAMRGNAQRLVATIGGGARPPGGFVLAWPFGGTPPAARVDGRPVPWRDGALTFRRHRQADPDRGRAMIAALAAVAARRPRPLEGQHPQPPVAARAAMPTSSTCRPAMRPIARRAGRC